MFRLTWRERLNGWNRQYPQWRFKDVRDFQGTFARAEQSLTGEKFGLEWFYNPVAQHHARDGLPELFGVKNNGSHEEKRFAKRKLQESKKMVSSIRELMERSMQQVRRKRSLKR